jgi:endonuclease-3
MNVAKPNKTSTLLPGSITRIILTLEEVFGRPSRPTRREDPLDSLIATLLSQNTNDRNSHQAWVQLRRRFPSWRDVARAPLSRLASTIRVGGLKNQKARRMKEILRTIKKDRGAYRLDFLKKLSDDEAIEYLTSMKGVGLKTAACVLVFALGRDVFPVDTHIHRVLNRLGLVRTKSAEETFERMRALLPKGHAYSFHVNLIRFGRTVCRAQRPQCHACSMYELCSFPEKERFAQSGSSKISSRAHQNFLILHNLKIS